MPIQTSDLLTPSLGLPLLAPAQARKHVTVNDALTALDALAQIAVLRSDLTEPPSEPSAEGDRYRVAPNASGDWTGQDGALADFVNGGWLFRTPQPGWIVWDRADGAASVFTDAGWQALGGAGAGVSGPLAKLGINTPADDTNRLAVSSDATLFSHAGTDHRVAVNRASDADTASLIFQTDYAGVAEIGMTGSEDFAVKALTPNGWTTALSVAQDSGAVSLPRSAYAAAALSNLFRDSGTFCGDFPDSRQSQPPFVTPPWVRHFNGATLGLEDTFNFNSASNIADGNAPANGPIAQALAEQVYSGAPLHLVSSFNVARLDAGPDTRFGVVFADGTVRYPQIYRLPTRVPADMTYSFYIRSTGSGVGILSDASQSCAVDLVETGDNPVVPGDGVWHHVRIVTHAPYASYLGRDANSMRVYLRPNESASLALLAAMTGRHILPSTIGMIACVEDFHGA